MICPSVGLGTHELTGNPNLSELNPELSQLNTNFILGEKCMDIVSIALQSGYRLIDTARCYKNEAEIGRALRESGIDRADIFVTSKVSTKEMGIEKSYEAVLASLKALDLSYLDLVLIHWPGVKGKPLVSTEHREKRFEAFKALLKAKNDNLVRHVGVSNFTTKHLSELFEDCAKEMISMKPYLNQVEVHPLCPQRDLIEFCQTHDIIVQGYSSLGHGQLLSHDVVKQISERRGNLEFNPNLSQFYRKL